MTDKRTRLCKLIRQLDHEIPMAWMGGNVERSKAYAKLQRKLMSALEAFDRECESDPNY